MMGAGKFAAAIFDFTQHTPDDGAQLAELMRRVPKLTTIDVRGNESLGPSGAHALIEWLQADKASGTHKLRSLNGVGAGGTKFAAGSMGGSAAASGRLSRARTRAASEPAAGSASAGRLSEPDGRFSIAAKSALLGISRGPGQEEQQAAAAHGSPREL